MDKSAARGGERKARPVDGKPDSQTGSDRNELGPGGGAVAGYVPACKRVL